MATQNQKTPTKVSVSFVAQTSNQYLKYMRLQAFGVDGNVLEAVYRYIYMINQIPRH